MTKKSVLPVAAILFKGWTLLKSNSYDGTDHYNIVLYRRFLTCHRRKDDIQCKISYAKLLTTTLLSVHYFRSNFHSACCYMKEHHGVKIIDKSGFIPRLHSLKEKLLALFAALGQSIR
jgi:hypothetical protein